MQREPAFWIGLAVTIIVGAVDTIAGAGVISDTLRGRIDNLFVAAAQFLVLVAPLVAGLFIRQRVTPTAAPVLAPGTPVTTPEGTSAIVHLVFKPAP
jgi:hypothetical protein